MKRAILVISAVVRVRGVIAIVIMAKLVRVAAVTELVIREFPKIGDPSMVP